MEAVEITFPDGRGDPGTPAGESGRMDGWMDGPSDAPVR